MNIFPSQAYENNLSPVKFNPFHPTRPFLVPNLKLLYQFNTRCFHEWRKARFFRGKLTLPMFVENFSTFSRLRVSKNTSKKSRKCRKSRVVQTKAKLISRERSYLPNSWKQSVLGSFVAHFSYLCTSVGNVGVRKWNFFLTRKTSKENSHGSFFFLFPRLLRK